MDGSWKVCSLCASPTYRTEHINRFGDYGIDSKSLFIPGVNCAASRSVAPVLEAGAPPGTPEAACE